MELNSWERALCDLYQRHPDETQREMTQNDFKAFYRKAGGSEDDLPYFFSRVDLSEEDFFALGEDVAVIRHLRYLPPIRHCHAFVEIMLIADGSCVTRIEDEAVTLNKGDICILSPGGSHSVFACDDSALIYNILVRSSTFETTFFSVLADKDVLSRFFGRTLHNKQQNSYLIFQTGDDSQIQTFFRFLNEEYLGREDYRNRMMANILQGIFILLLRHHDQHVLLPKKSPLSGENEIFAILNYIQSHFSDLTIEALAARFGYSTRHMSRLIRESSGMSYGELIRAARMQRAAKLLDNPDISTDEIIRNVGYADYSGFQRAFKQYFGLTPSEYRQRRAAGSI